MNSEQRRQFVLRHRTAIFGYNRAEHGPAMSVVYYSATPDEILVSTMAERAKAKAVARSPKPLRSGRAVAADVSAGVLPGWTRTSASPST